MSDAADTGDVLAPHRLYDAPQVARLVFQHSPRWFRENRARLHSRDAFPQPMHCTGRPRWLGRDLIAWRDRPKEAQPELAGTVDFSAVLRERARTIAGGGRKRA